MTPALAHKTLRVLTGVDGGPPIAFVCIERAARLRG